MMVSDARISIEKGPVSAIDIRLRLWLTDYQVGESFVDGQYIP